MYKRKIYMVEFECGESLSVELNHDGGVSIGGENGDTNVFVDSQNSYDLSHQDVTEMFTVFSTIMRDRKKA